MLEAGLTKGVTIHFPAGTNFETSRVHDTPQEDTASVQNLTLTLSSKTYQTTSQVTYLPFSPGIINYAETDGDVLSGFFSGCFMPVYRKNGVRRVAHVATTEHVTEAGDCKDVMRRLLNTPEYELINSVKPYRDQDIARFRDIMQAENITDPMRIKVFGLVAADNRCYALFTQKIADYEFKVMGPIERQLT